MNHNHLIMSSAAVPDSTHHSEDEPSNPLGLGTKRASSRDITGSTTPAPVGGGLNRRPSVKNVKLDGGPSGATTTTSAGTQSIQGNTTTNFLQNIHSTPFGLTVGYTPPSYAKSESDAEFISIALQRNFVFANALSDEDHARRREERLIVDAFEPYVANVGDVILSGDVVGDYFYILKEGIINYMDVNTGKLVRSAKRPGQSFGELCLLYDCPPPANCVAGGTGTTGSGGKNVVKLWRLNKTTFRQIMALTSIRKDETLRKALKKVPMLKLLEDEFINRIGDSLDVRQVEKGTVLYSAGDTSDTLYLLEYDGKVQITPQGGGKSSTLGPGEVFGEEAIQNPPPARTETVRTLEKTTLFTITREGLHRIIGNLEDAIQLSQTRRWIQSVPLFQNSDLEGYEFELLAALMEKVKFKGGKEVVLEDEMVESPALYVVYEGVLEVECEKDSKRDGRALKMGDYFGEGSLLPDKNMRFGGKGGNKCESVGVVCCTVLCCLNVLL